VVGANSGFINAPERVPTFYDGYPSQYRVDDAGKDGVENAPAVDEPTRDPQNSPSAIHDETSPPSEAPIAASDNLAIETPSACLLSAAIDNSLSEPFSEKEASPATSESLSHCLDHLQGFLEKRSSPPTTPEPMSDDEDCLSDYDSEGCSPFSSPELMTPIDIDDGSTYPSWPRFLVPLIEDKEHDTHDFYANQHNPFDQQMIFNDTQRNLFDLEEEEEDELPPLDDWYLSVASRHGISIGA